MTTAKAFREIALGLSDVIEAAHMGHPDFRTRGKIFASLPAPDRGMVKLTPDQQARFVADFPEAFGPEAGAWGRQGYTRVHLQHADAERIGEAMTLAWQNVNAERPRRRTSRGAG